MPGHSDRPYRVVYPENQRRLLRVYAARAAGRGLLGAYLTAVKSIQIQLATAPLVWGDPHNRLPHLRLQLFHGIHAPLHAFYAVDEERRIVYIRQIKPLPHQGLDEGA